MTQLAVDTWAFVELAFDRPRAQEVGEAFETATGLFTTREVVAETYGFLLRRAGTLRAREWLDAITTDEVPILAPPLAEIHRVLGRLPKESTLSFVDISLGLAAAGRGAEEVATADREFIRMRLTPKFAF